MNSVRHDGKPHLVLARELYDGIDDDPKPDCAIEIENGRVNRLRPVRPGEWRDPSIPVADIVAPGFIDMQINGANDVQFNSEVSEDAVRRIAIGARRGGAAYLMPTFITAPGHAYRKAISAVDRAIKKDLTGILGIHLEGPFLSPRRPGIHLQSAIRPMDRTDIVILTQKFSGVLLVTLAPECQPPSAVSALIDAGVIVFAGHSDATARELDHAVTSGVTGVTHLFNAMSQVTAREPGVVGSVLASDHLFAGIIVDGHHVDKANVKIAVRALPERLCLVTDAMPTLFGEKTAFELDGTAIQLVKGRLTDAGGRLAGAHLSMDEAVRNLIRFTSVSKNLAFKMASRNPAMALGLGNELGCLRPGFRAGLTLLNSELHAVGVVSDGLLFLSDPRQIKISSGFSAHVDES